MTNVLEERAIQDLPWANVLISVKLAQDELGFPAYDQVRSKLEEELDKDIGKWQDSPKLRKAIGAVAKKRAGSKTPLEVTCGLRQFLQLIRMLIS